MTSTSGPTSPVLNDAQRDITGKALQATLSELIGLHLAAKQAHWTVVGPFFRSVHTQLDELVTSARGFADQVAERASAIGVAPDGRASTVAADAGIAEPNAEWRSDRTVIDSVVSMLADIIGRLRARIDETDKTDSVTQDLLISIAAELEKAHWMWQARTAE